MKLYHFPISPNSRRVWAVINHLGLNCELVTVDLSKGEQLKPSFVAINPNHMIPTFVDDHVVLWESHAIMTYLCDVTPGQDLLPAEPVARADVMRWLFWNASHWNPTCGIFVFERLVKPALKLGETDPSKIADGEERFQRFGSVNG
jgi:glutathione S-transferase